MSTTVPKLFKLDDFRLRRVKVILTSGRELICEPQEFFPDDDELKYTVEILEGPSAGFSRDLSESEIASIEPLS